MKTIPTRLAEHFWHRKERHGICRGDTTTEAFVCRRCGQAVKPNSLGATSHLGKHVGEALRARGIYGPPVPKRADGQ